MATIPGNDPSFKVLSTILDEWEAKDPKKRLWRKVTRRIHSFRERVKSLRDMKHPQHREELLRLLLGRVLTEIEESGWPENVQTHLCCCITTIFREEMRKVLPEVRQWNIDRWHESRRASAQS